MKRFNASTRSAGLLIALISLAAPSAVRADDAAPPGAPPKPCVLVVGGGVPVTPDAKINAFWLAVNKVVAGDVEAELTKRGYAVDEIIADNPDSSLRLGAVARQLNQDKCAKAVQVSIGLKAAPGKPDVASTFEFDILAFHLDIADVPGKPMKSIRVAGDYSRSYAYPLTKETMDTLSMTAVSAQIAADIDAAKVLPRAN